MNKKDEPNVKESVDGEEKSTVEDDSPIIIEDEMKPVKNPCVSIREEMEEENKYMLFNPDNELILIINRTGRFILDNCDGEKTVSGIVREIQEQFEIDGDISLPGLVKNYLVTLLKADLIKL